MPVLEIIAFVFTLICVYFTVKRNILCWPFGIIGVSVFGVTMYQAKLYADMGLQIVFLLQSIYGWYNWAHENPADKKIKPELMTVSQRVITVLGIAAFTFVVGNLLGRFTDAVRPFWDSLATAVSLVANWLLARKVFENWILWVSVDVLYVILFLERGLYIYSVLYFIFLILATQGLLSWRKELVAEPG